MILQAIQAEFNLTPQGIIDTLQLLRQSILKQLSMDILEEGI